MHTHAVISHAVCICDNDFKTVFADNTAGLWRGGLQWRVWAKGWLAVGKALTGMPGWV